MEEFLDKLKLFLIDNEIWLKVLTAIFASVFAGWQIHINLQLKKFHDSVAITATPFNDKIKLMNVGKTNMFIKGFELPNNIQSFDKPRLIPANTGDASYYWIPVPKNMTVGEKFDIKLYLIDEFEREWVSEHGGVLDSIDEENQFKGRIWSYKTYKK